MERKICYKRLPVAEEELQCPDSCNGRSAEVKNKARLARETERELRRTSGLNFWGSGGMLQWFAKSVYQTFFLYGAVTTSIFILRSQGISIIAMLGVNTSYRPFLVQALQFLAAFLVGVGLTDAFTRYKTAMTALCELYESVENLRMVLLSSTEDVKFRVAVQVHISWIIVLLRKKIAFYTEDFEQPISTLVDGRFSNSILFMPEVLWAFDLAQAEYVFHSFLENAHLFDREGAVKKACTDVMHSAKSITSLLMVRSPTTRHVLGRACVEMFLISLPIFNQDLVTLAALPFVAAVLVAIIHLSSEISEPWGEEFHHLPVKAVMSFLSVPTWVGDDKDEAEKAIIWLNKGMSESDWTWNGEDPIPREKRQGSNKGAVINFEDYRSMHLVTGYKSFASFVSMKAKDMSEAASRGRRMPKYLHWRSDESFERVC